MADFTIEELVIPRDARAEGWDDFTATVDVRNQVESVGYGTTEMNVTARELLPGWQRQEHKPRRLFAARVGTRIVARALIETLADEGTDAAWLSVEVLPDWRGHGIGRALADQVEGLAQADGRTSLLVYAVSPDALGERLAAPTGYGSVPRGNPEVRFLLSRGYRLEQISRGSRLALPVDPRIVDGHMKMASARAGKDYALHYWIDRVPSRWREDVAVLNTRMSTDAPTAGLDEPEDVWDVQRVLDYEESEAQSPRTMLTAAVEHRPTGILCGFTELSVPAETERHVGQEDTLVLKEHRGHRLGMLLKAANLRHLAQQRPGHPSVITFNAEENRHMLDVNEAIGFTPIGYEGGWKRTISGS